MKTRQTVQLLDAPGALDRTREQRLTSLELANEIRFARARLKKQIAAGQVSAVDTLQTPPGYAHTMKVATLLDAIPGWGPRKVQKTLRRVKIADGKTVGGLTAMRRNMLVAHLEKALA